MESEKRVLGAILNGHQEPLTELEPDDFYDKVICRAYTAARDLSEEGLEVTTLVTHERSGVPINDLEDYKNQAAGISESQVSGLIKELQRVGGLRKLYRTCKGITENISKDAKLEEVAQELETSLYSMDREGSSEAKDGSEVMQNVLNDFLKRQQTGGGPEVSTGLKALDKAIIGLRPGKVLVIAGRPSMGKTALSSTVRRSVVSQELGVIEFNLEMSAEELLERELAYASQINLRKILAAKDVTDEELERARGVAGSLVPGRWFIDDRTCSISGIRRRARIISKRMARQGIKLGLVVIDYLQLAGDNGEGREQSIAAISRGCKLMAKELGCTVMVLSQLNRACEVREDRRPMLSDLRESGAIEQDADIVMFVYRHHMYEMTYPPEDAEVLIRKQRNGPTGSIQLRYNPKLVTFEDP